MLYSDVINSKLILPRKDKYTLADVKSVLVESLFRGPRTLNEDEAKFVVRCSAVFWDTEFSDNCRPAKRWARIFKET